MTTIVMNIGNFERDSSGQETTNTRKTFGEVGTVRVGYQGIEYVFGPGEVKTIQDDGIAAALIAGDSRLSAGDSRVGLPKGNASLSTYRF